MDPRLNGMHIAIIAAQGFEQIELEQPKKTFEAEGAITKIISEAHGKISGMESARTTDGIIVDLTLDEADAKDFDAVLLPNGAANIEHISENRDAINFVRGMNGDHKPIVAIGNGISLLMSADLVAGKIVAADITLKNAIESAGGTWVDEAVVVDENFVTSRTARDMAAFSQRMIEVVGQRMQDHLRGTADEHAVGIASS